MILAVSLSLAAPEINENKMRVYLYVTAFCSNSCLIHWAYNFRIIHMFWKFEYVEQLLLVCGSVPFFALTTCIIQFGNQTRTSLVYSRRILFMFAIYPFYFHLGLMPIADVRVKHLLTICRRAFGFDHKLFVAVIVITKGNGNLTESTIIFVHIIQCYLLATLELCFLSRNK